MKKRILAYLDYIDELLKEDNKDWEKERKKHLVQIQFFAHERLVHLIVLVLFALATVFTIFYINFTGELIMVALFLALLVLLIPYISHYYLLENSVQRMYKQYDSMMNKIEPSFQMNVENIEKK